MDPAVLNAKLLAFHALIRPNLDYILSMHHIPGLYDGTYIPTFHLDFTYDPKAALPARQFQLKSARQITLADLDAFVQSHPGSPSPMKAKWDEMAAGALASQAGTAIECPTPAGSKISHSAFVQYVLTAFVPEGAPSNPTTLRATLWHAIHIQHITASAMDPRTANINFEAAIRAWLADDDVGAQYPQHILAGKLAKCFLEADADWALWGSLWASMRDPLGGISLTFRERELAAIARTAPTEVGVRPGCIVYALPHEIPIP